VAGIALSTVSADPGSRLLSRDAFRLRYASKSEVVYRLLREAILTGEMRPGQRIVMDALAARLGISKIPIREALGRLGAEGLVETTPHVGARVSAPPTIRELRDIYAVRAWLEAMAARAAALALGARDVMRLRAILAREMRLGTRPLERTVYTRLNREFHTTIFRAARNQLLERLCEELLDRSARYRASAGALQTQHTELLREHQAIVESLERHDAGRAGALMRRHVEGGLRRLEQFLLHAPGRRPVSSGGPRRRERGRP
jgi:DNA-binding GntR family transcriptional regulator